MIIPGMGDGGFIFSGSQSNVLLDAELVSIEYGSGVSSVTAPAGAAYYDIYAIGPGGTGGNGMDNTGGQGGRGGDFYAVENLFVQDTAFYFMSFAGNCILSNNNHPFSGLVATIVGGDSPGSRSSIAEGQGGTVLDEFFGGVGGAGYPYNHGGGGGGAANGGGGVGVSCHGGNGVNSTGGFSGAGGAPGTGIFPAGSGGQGATVNLIGFPGNNYGGGGAGSGRNNGVNPLGAPGWLRIRFKSSNAQARLITPSGTVLPPKGP